MKKIEIESGKKIHKLKFIEEVEKKNKSRMWLCQCDCGRNKVINLNNILCGKSKSCGCLRKQQLIDRSTTHGKTGSVEYNAWLNMLARCSAKSGQNYKNYGGRGIKVCERWLDSFENFYEDMGPKPSEKQFSIERINNDLGYSKDNCKWGTIAEQSRNKRPNNNGLPIGVKQKYSSKFEARIGFNGKRVYIGTFDTAEEAAIAYDNKCEEFGEGRPNQDNKRYNLKVYING